MTTTDIHTNAVRDIVRRVEEVWAENDADSMADVFAEDASLLLPGDVYLKDREQVRAYFKMGYGGPLKGSRVAGRPVNIKHVSDDVAIVITEGGVLYPGQTEVSTENAIRATWVLARHGQEWLVTAYHNTRTAST
jgi:uncharacterized protein (TIGR02246 family)